MTYVYNLPNQTSGGDNILVGVATAVNTFTPAVLAFVWFVVMLGGVSRQKVRTGTADYPMWTVIASLATLMLALMMTTIEGVIHVDILIIVVTVTIFSGAWLFLDKRSSEI